jgi:Carboxypeptidase regulatory-like domain
MIGLAMRRHAVSILALLVMWVGRASADDPPTEAPPTEPTPAPTPPAPTPEAPPPAVETPAPTSGPTYIEGRATDVLGRPIAGARVYVLPRRGEPIQSKTDKNGHYKVQVQSIGTHGVVIAIDKAHSFRTVLVQQGRANRLDIDVELDTEGGEVIKIEDARRPVPKVVPKPQKDTRINPPYSEEAVERDAWARAWLLLDVDEKGKVTRLKLLKAPGFDLNQICIDEAFKLGFDPALDDAGQPMKTYMLWTMEWPAWGWLIQGNGTAVRRPADHYDVVRSQRNELNSGAASGGRIGGTWATPPVGTGQVFEGALDRVPCAGSGPLNLDLRNRAYRDCSAPDLSIAPALPWITRETVATAVAELKNPNLILIQDKDYKPGSPWPGYIAAGVSAALAIATVYGFYQWNDWQAQAEDQAFQATVDPDEYARITGNRDKWGKRALGLTAVTILTGGAALILWNRNQKKSSFSVQPTESPKSQSSFSGATATYSLSF